MTSAESVKYFYEVILSENKLERISDETLFEQHLIEPV